MINKNTSFHQTPKPIRCRNHSLVFNTPLVMGILNLTPDSFYDGGKYETHKQQALQTEKMLREGAAIIDVGAISTRPGAVAISEEEELKRLLAPLKRLVRLFPEAVFSVDTYRSEVARQCVENGAQLVNDISGGTLDQKMFETIGDLGVPYVLMHIHGTPQNMQDEPIAISAVKKIAGFFGKQVNKLKAAKVRDIILDTGFGFGKTPECNYALLKHLEELRVDNLPLMAGISRKSMVNKVIGTKPATALNGSTVLHTIALLNGANILRVHDVKEAVEAIKIVSYYKISDEC